MRASFASPTGISKVCILVEGPSDVAIYKKFVDLQKIWITGAGGIFALNDIIHELESKYPRLIGIQDADFAHLEKKNPSSPRIFFTDYHDIEMTILHTPNLALGIFTKYGMENRFQTLWRSVIELASFIGYIRWYNEKYQCNISFKGLFSHDNVNISNCDTTMIIEKLNTQSKIPITQDAISEFIATYRTSDTFNLCNGHDVIKLLTFAINKGQFFKDLESSFEYTHFAQTMLYIALFEWQNKNGFNILYPMPTS